MKRAKRPVHGGHRKGAGRKPEVDEAIPITVAMPQAAVGQLDRIAAAARITRAKLVRTMLLNQLDAIE